MGPGGVQSRDVRVISNIRLELFRRLSHHFPFIVHSIRKFGSSGLVEGLQRAEIFSCDGVCSCDGASSIAESADELNS